LKPYWGKPTVRNFRGGGENTDVLLYAVHAVRPLSTRRGELGCGPPSNAPRPTEPINSTAIDLNMIGPPEMRAQEVPGRDDKINIHQYILLCKVRHIVVAVSSRQFDAAAGSRRYSEIPPDHGCQEPKRLAGGRALSASQLGHLRSQQSALGIQRPILRTRYCVLGTSCAALVADRVSAKRL
jgi:hypothetical protein